MKHLKILLALLTMLHATYRGFSNEDNIRTIKEHLLTDQNATVLPFTLVSGLILVEASIDGRKGNFIVDTGAPRVILNSIYFFKGSRKSKISYSDVKGNKAPLKEKNINIRLVQIEKNNLCVVLMDLSQLEKRHKVETLGLIGSSFFRNMELLIDYASQTLILFELDKKGNRISEVKHPGQPSETLDFNMKGHIPYMNLHYCGFHMKLGLDTGSGVNLMEERWKEKMNRFFLQVQYRFVGGVASPSPQLVTATSLGEAYIGSIRYEPMLTSFFTLNIINNSLPGITLDGGILGYPFLSQHKIAFNFRKRQLYIWKTPDELKNKKRMYAKSNR